MVYEPLDDATDTQFELSYELLYFLRWLVEQENEHAVLKTMMQRAFLTQFQGETIRLDDKQNDEEIQNLQYSIVELFTLLDSLLHEALQEKSLQKVTEQKLTQTIQKIDGASCSDATLCDTIEETAHEIERSPNKNPKAVLCETLLKQWRPVTGQESH